MSASENSDDLNNGASAERLRSRLWPYLLLVLEVVVFYLPKVWGGRVLFPGDILYAWSPWIASYPAVAAKGIYNPILTDSVNIGFPAYHLVAENIRSLMVLWDPATAVGGPVQTLEWYPPYFLLLSLHLPVAVATTCSLILHSLLAGMFCYAFARALGISKWGSIIGASLYMWNGYNLVWLEYQVLQRSLTWLPLALLLLLRSVQTGRIAARIGAGLAVAMILAAASLQFAIYDLALITLFALALAMHTGRYLRTAFSWMVSMLIGFGLTTIYYLQQYAVLAASTRGQDVKGWIQFPPAQLVSLVWPNLFGNPVDGTFWRSFNYTESTLYISAVGVTLAWFGWKALPVKWRIGTGLLMIVTVAIAIGLPGFRWIQMLPAVGALAHARSVYMLIPLLALLGAAGADRVAGRLRDPVNRTTVALEAVGVFLAVIVLVGIDFVMVITRPNAMANLDALHLTGNQVMRYLVSLGYPLMFWALMLAVLTASARRGRKIVLPLLCIIASVDLMMIGWHYEPAIRADRVYPPLPELDYLRSVGGKFRVGTIRAMPGEAVYPPNTLKAYDLESPDLFGSFLDARFVHYLTAMGTTRAWSARADVQGFDSPMSDAMNIEFVLSAAEPPRLPEKLKLVFRTPTCWLFRNTQAVPRASFVGNVEWAGDEREALQLLRDPKWNPRQLVVLEGPEGIDRNFNGASSPPGEARVVRYGPHQVVVGVSATRRGVLILADAYASGWTALVDGIPTRLYRANSLFRGVIVEPGEHRVEFRYRPAYLQRSAILSSLLLALSALALLVERMMAKSGALSIKQNGTAEAVPLS